MASSSGDEFPAPSVLDGGDDSPRALPPQTTFREFKDTPHDVLGPEHLAIVPFNKWQHAQQPSHALAIPRQFHRPPAMPSSSVKSTVQAERQPSTASTPAVASDSDSPAHKPRRSQRQMEKEHAMAHADDGDDLQVEFLVPRLFSFMSRESWCLYILMKHSESCQLRCVECEEMVTVANSYALGRRCKQRRCKDCYNGRRSLQQWYRKMGRSDEWEKMDASEKNKLIVEHKSKGMGKGKKRAINVQERAVVSDSVKLGNKTPFLTKKQLLGIAHSLKFKRCIRSLCVSLFMMLSVATLLRFITELKRRYDWEEELYERASWHIPV